MPYRMTVNGTPIVVHTNCRPIRWAGKLGLTLGRRIFLGPPARETWPGLLAHEFCHVLQWERLGTITFLTQYLLGLVLYGYGLKHPMERESCEYALQEQHRFVDLVAAIGGRA